MIYRTVTITQVMDEWVVEFRDGSDKDREPTDTIPNPLGFYHYPSTMTKVEALTALTARMSKLFRDEAERLNLCEAALTTASEKVKEKCLKL